MTYHTFIPETYHNTIGWHDPVMFIDDGDTVCAETADAHGFDRHGNQLLDRFTGHLDITCLFPEPRTPTFMAYCLAPVAAQHPLPPGHAL